MSYVTGRSLMGICVLAGSALAGPLAAQSSAWRLQASAGHAWFGGGVEDTTGGNLWGGPETTVAWNLGVDHTVGPVRIGAGLSYATSKLRFEGQDISLVDNTIDMEQVVVSLVARAPLLKVGSAGAALAVAAGPLVDFWSLTGEPGRSRFGGLGALEFSAPVSQALHLLATATGSFSGSPYEEGEITPEFQETTFWTWAFGLGVRYGL